MTAFCRKYESVLSLLAVVDVAAKSDLADGREHREAREVWVKRIVELAQSRGWQRHIRILSSVLLSAKYARYLFGLLKPEQHRKALSLAEVIQVGWRAMLCKNEHRPVTTACIWGAEEQLNSAVMETIHEFPERTPVASLISDQLLDLADGLQFAFTVNLEGEVKTVSSIDWPDRTGTQHVSPSRCLSHCRATAKADVLSILACGTHGRLNIFHGGQLKLESLAGSWRERDLPRFQDQAAELGRRLKCPKGVIEQLCRAALDLSEEQCGAVFLIGEEQELLARCDQGTPKSADSVLRQPSIPGLPMGALIAMARRDGAVLIDGATGKVIRHGTFLRPQPSTEIRDHPEWGSRHTSAAKITAETDSLAIVVSQDARVTLCHRGHGIEA